MLTKNKETSVKKLNIKGKYSEFTDFYDTNKVKIYKNIINLFGTFKNKDKNELILVLSAKIMDLDWETELKFGRQEITVLIKDLIPYFESVEDYETCGEIHNLYLELSSI
jgi:hypothetical protein